MLYNQKVLKYYKSFYKAGLYLFNDGGTYDIEKSPLICSANLIGTSVMIELN